MDINKEKIYWYNYDNNYIWEIYPGHSKWDDSYKVAEKFHAGDMICAIWRFLSKGRTWKEKHNIKKMCKHVILIVMKKNDDVKDVQRLLEKEIESDRIYQIKMLHNYSEGLDLEKRRDINNQAKKRVKYIRKMIYVQDSMAEKNKNFFGGK